MRRQSGSGMGAPRRVLVVEDDVEVVRLLEELLVEQGYEVLKARNGVEAMAAVAARPPELADVILLDLGLPLESGVSVLRFLRDVMQSGLPVIVLTGRADPEEETAVRKLGVSEYLRKPVSPERVLAAVARALRP